MRRGNRETSISESFVDVKADYEAAKRTSRFQRRRRGVPTMGAGADYHYRSDADYLWMQEIARDLYRNDPVIGQLTDRAVVNTIGSGFSPDPDTGDDGANKDLKARWDEESRDPDLCSPDFELTFHDQETMALREMFVPGDVFGVPTPEGTVELRESHRCRSPHRTKKNMVHGVEMDKKTRRRLRYYFTNEPIDPLKPASQIKASDLTSVDARDEDGEAQVFHVFSPKRASQTRGITAYAPIIVPAGMFDDLNFTQLFAAQMHSHWLVVRQRDKTFFENNPTEQPIGTPSTTYTGTRRMEETAPGMELLGMPGETLQPWSPNVPNPEFFSHAKLILTLLGINLGMPLVLVLLDASETNFSGYRGAVDQARLGFRYNQRVLVNRWHVPYWRMKVNHWADEDVTLARLRETGAALQAQVADGRLAVHRADQRCAGRPGPRVEHANLSPPAGRRARHGVARHRPRNG